MKAHFILFVSDQKSSSSFYSHVLASEPSLNVPGMTEFELGGGAALGLMPATGAANLLGSVVTSGGPSPPLTETYIVVDDSGAFHGRAVAAGGREISPLSERDWGHSAAYCLDPDGHIIAFAEVTNG
jgi:uncharacterized protein